MASKSKTMNFQWNYSAEAILQRKGFGKDLNKFFADTLVEFAEPYTPLKSGRLRASVTTENSNQMRGKIQYLEGGVPIPYADYQYELIAKHRTTPGTTDHWLDYAWNTHKFQICGKVGAYRKWHSK